MKIRIATRRSRLAMWQTEHVARELQKHHPHLEIEIVPLQTLGDKDRSTALSSFDRTGIFTKEIEDALLLDQGDIGVHSFKDMATQIPKGLKIGAVLEREDPRDAFVSKAGLPLDQLHPGSQIGTSSMRRKAMLLHNRDDLAITELRGNVPTRLRAVGIPISEGKEPIGPPLDGTILALAGLRRLGLEKHLTEILDTATFLPAPAQGAIAVQRRDGDTATADIINCLNDEITKKATTAERTFLRVLEGGCQLPIGALATIENKQIVLKGIILNLDGSRFSYGFAEGFNAKEVGTRLAEDLKRRGGKEILEEVASQTPPNTN